jgi:hypothetical protein
MLHPQNGHVPEPHCCHCSPAANGETDRPDLKLVPFACRTDARLVLAYVAHPSLQYFDALGGPSLTEISTSLIGKS